MEIMGVTHPIPTEIAERIYEEGKNVFVGKRCLCRVNKGDKFIIYESHGSKSYTGWADINFISKMEPKIISKKYKNVLMLTGKELDQYSKNREEMFVIEFNNFQKFSKPVKPKRFVSISGKYIYEDEYKMIKDNKG